MPCVFLSCFLGSRCDTIGFRPTASEIRSIKAPGNFSVINVTDSSGQVQGLPQADGETSFSGLAPGTTYLFTFTNGSSTCCQEMQIGERGFSFGLDCGF